MASEKFWYSPIYEQHNNGFFVSKDGNKYYLGFKYKNGKELYVKISYDTFNVLRKEWK